MLDNDVQPNLLLGRLGLKAPVRQACSRAIETAVANAIAASTRFTIIKFEDEKFSEFSPINTISAWARSPQRQKNVSMTVLPR